MAGIDVIMTGLQAAIPHFAPTNGEFEAKLIDVVGTYADTEAFERNRTLDIINQALASQKVTTIEYYRRKAVAFQMGDQLIYDPITFAGYYDPINPENQIVVQAYIVGQVPDFTMLINGVDANGHLRKLTDTEVAAFRTYFTAFQPLGLEITIISLDVAIIYDSDIVIHVRAGSNAADVVDNIISALTAYESTFRTTNAVTLTELENIFESVDGVTAVGFSDPYAVETGIDGVTRTVRPVEGVFNLTAGAFTFGSDITVDNIKVIQ